MIGRRRIVHLAVLALVAIAPFANADTPIVFEPLETKMRVNSMALTEDRKQLGKHVLVQSEFSHSSHSTRRYPYAHFINPGTRKTISQGEYLGGRKKWMYQARPEDFWVAEQQLLEGTKLSPFGGTTGDVLLADELKSMFYSIKGKSLTAHRYDKVLTELGERDVINAPHRQNKKMGGRGGYRFIRPIAVTHTPNLYMFVHHSGTGKVHRAVTRAFSLSKTAARPRSPSPKLPGKEKTVAPTARDISALRSFAPTLMTNGDIVREFAGAIVRIDDVESTHTGVIVGSRGFVLTRALKGAHPDVHYQIDVGDRSVTFKARAQVVKNDTDSNLALLKFDATSRLASVRLASDPPRKNGTNVFALGFGEKTVASGKWNTSENQPVFKPTNESPSKSGLPLFDKNGQVVGLVIDSGIMPTDILRLFLKSVIKE